MPNKTLSRVVVPFAIKADTIDPNARTFEGLAAVWTLDLGNDVIKRGAFKDTLAEWKGSGDAIPLLNSHDHYNIMSALGQLIAAKETKDGLWTKWEVIDGPDGDAALTRLRPSARTGRAAVGKMSIGYEAMEYSYEQPEGTQPWDRIRHLDKVDLKEVSLVLFPMAPGASIDSSTVKSFLRDAIDTDPAKVDVETKQELRRLASRIGILLKQRSTDTPETPIDAPDDELVTIDAKSTVPPTPPSPTPTPAPKPAPAPSPAPAPTPAPVPSAKTGVAPDDASEKPDDKIPTGEKKTDDVVYQYDEALQQRLQKTLLKHKVSAIGHKDT